MSDLFYYYESLAFMYLDRLAHFVLRTLPLWVVVLSISYILGYISTDVLWEAAIVLVACLIQVCMHYLDLYFESLHTAVRLYAPIKQISTAIYTYHPFYRFLGYRPYRLYILVQNTGYDQNGGTDPVVVPYPIITLMSRRRAEELQEIGEGFYNLTPITPGIYISPSIALPPLSRYTG